VETRCDAGSGAPMIAGQPRRPRPARALRRARAAHPRCVRPRRAVSWPALSAVLPMQPVYPLPTRPVGTQPPACRCSWRRRASAV